MLNSVTRLLGFGSRVTAKPKPDEAGQHIIFLNETKGWAGSGFERQTTELSARRVYNDRDETQISVQVTTFYEKTQRTVYGHLALDAAQLAAFIEHLSLIPVEKKR